MTNIERNEAIRFHERGTLEAVTRWISSHHDGVAEWLKNVRRQYQLDRANVKEEHRVAVLLLQDAKGGRPARIGVLDVGGATLEDVTAWSTWQDPEASRRGSDLEEEETQGNGGKAYMFRLFTGQTRILGVRDRRRNCKGFDGPAGTVDRGTPGWIPSVAAGREVEISSFEGELKTALEPYGIDIGGLPPQVQKGVIERQSFTLVEGQEPIELYKGRIDSDDLIAKVVRHEQSMLCLEQVDVFTIHNGRLLNDGKKLVLPPITPYPEIDSPFVHPIPEQLPLESSELVSTTEAGMKDPGRLILHTSMDNMPHAYKNLRPRWQIIYRTRHQMIGAKSVGELVPATPGAAYVYGTLELPALEPAYVEHGRRRPKNGPLVEAVDRFVAEKIREVAHLINARRKQDLDDRALDEVHRENRTLDEFKNKFLPMWGEQGGGGAGNTGAGPSGGGGGGPVEWGEIPEALELVVPAGGIQIARSLSIALKPLLEIRVRDSNGRPVKSTVEWFTTEARVASVSREGVLTANDKGECAIWARVQGTAIETERLPVRVWNVDHVLLTPRTLEIPLGSRERVTAEVTDDDGRRSTDVLLDWKHDAEDPLIVRISRLGTVTGNRLGKTAITAGAAPIWARIPAEVTVVPNPEAQKRGSGFPRLLLTGRDLDPATGTVREGDPDQPALWQEPSDYVHNVWWLNLQSADAAFAFRQRSTDPTLWRAYHAERVIDMVVQVWMTEEFTRKGEQQRPDFWAAHLAAMDRHRVQRVQEMWKRLEGYVQSGHTVDDEVTGR